MKFLTLLAVLAMSAPTTAEAAVFRDVVYRAQPGVDARDLSLDLTTPDGVKKAPLVVFIHGGGWRAGDKGHAAKGKAAIFNARGIAFASVNYRLYPDANPGEMAEDVVTSIAFLRANAARYGIDPDKIAVMGHSAGAHLAALTAADQPALVRGGVPVAAIKAVILLDGAGYDVARQVRDGRNASLYLKIFGDDPADWARWAPVSHARRAHRLPPFLIAHVGRADSTVQSGLLAAAVEDGGGIAQVLIARGETHATINRGFGEAGDATTIATFAVLARAFR